MRVGIEVGGTFTDLVAIADGEVLISKVPSTPADPHEGALEATRAGAIDLAKVQDLVHGSTVATNAILERKGARIAFLVTRGFRDLLLLQRHNRRNIYDLAYAKPEPVVARDHVFEIDERIDAQGRVITALDESAVTAQLREQLVGAGYEAIAICLLSSYAEPLHERRLAAILGQLLPAVSVTCSCDVTREFREYERASTTTLSAYVQPVIDGYLGRFEQALARRGFKGRFSVMQSNGGRLPANGMSGNAITSLFSGPAAGVVGAVRQAGLSGYENLITLDMGGTSTDVCMVTGGKPALASETEVDGLPIRTPVLDIVTVGAGGGSIVWRDDGGMLRVGPQSAGAEPGPACYQRGGTRPTITDAHVIRGTVRPQAFLGGRMAVDAALARDAFGAIAGTFGVGEETLADDAVKVADNNIVRAIQLVSTERGRDPRDCVLMPFGGAGPLHAARVAEALNMTTLCVPPAAGVLSAYGLLASDFVRYGTRTQKVTVDDAAADRVRSVFERMKTEAITGFAALGINDRLRFAHTLEMRYVGQAFEVPVELAAEELTDLTRAHLLQRFNQAHHRLFEFDDSAINDAEIVSFRLGASAPPDAIPNLRASRSTRAPGTAQIFDQGEPIACDLRQRLDVTEDPMPGPILIEDETSTIYVPRGWSVRLDRHHNLIAEQARS